MTTDRGIVLMIQAAVRGTIDFTQARQLDPAWWQKVRLILHGMEREDDFTLFREIYRWHLAFLGNSSLTAAGFREQQEAAQEVLLKLAAILRPWDAKTQQQMKREEYESLLAKYRKEIGDPDSPEFQAELQRQLEEFTASAATEETVNPEELLSQRCYEKILNTDRVRNR